MLREFIFLVILILLISGCVGWQLPGSGNASNREVNTEGTNSTAGGEPLGGTVIERTVPKNSSWKYAVFLPPNYNASRKYPVIIGLHGTGGDAMDYVNTWKEEAGKNGFILAFPQSPDTQGWDIRTINEFVAAVADDVEESYNITNMYLTGHSAGARMIVTVALLNPRFRGVAMVDGALPPWYCPTDIQYCSQEYSSKYGGCGCAEGQYFYMLNGANDDIVTPSEATEARSELEKCGVNITQRFLPNHWHEYPQEENVNIIGWFKSLESNKSITPIKCKSAS